MGQTEMIASLTIRYLSVARPDPDVRLLDRLLAVAEYRRRLTFLQGAHE